ncbi:condensation domain-containing protein [Streptomyces olivaceus]|uniref:condensation domain-containing protein n=1 Tax=Streptomyces TaxID=1883 RepID=UPI000878767F|nr:MULTISPECIES: condensation domain-containing protein [Streptomyces]AOW88293.1 lichenysin synthetase [Streptomyces olivaceus]MBZ6085406.1 condensation domain-containing protein [Streptomyces olivaceus]MBZ6204947.1 condensation domain-containing protein [Streptomyces olivaceus]MBZ6282968.1 condensation domain-containing protein [Streptomyces olivaceus]MCU8591132.1 condensation domain-containing protein [Streptomyces sp. A13(2022)]
MRLLKASAGQAVYHDFIVAPHTSVPAKRLFNCFIVEGPVDPARLERAVRHAIATHEALRTSLDDVDGAPTQVIREPDEITEAVMTTVDWDGSADSVADVVRSLDDRWTVHRELSMHVVLARAPGPRSLVACVLDHACVDGMSAETVTDLIRAEYNRPGGPPRPDQVPQFADYYAAMLEDGLEIYDDWLRILESSSPALPQWMLDLKRPSGRASTRERELSLSDATNERLRSLSKEYVCTPYEIVTAAVGLYFRRVDGAPVRVAVTHSGRHRRHGFDVVGLLRSQVVDVVDSGRCADVRSYLTERRDELRKCMTHFARLPVEEVCLRAGLSTGWRSGPPGPWEVELNGMYEAPAPEAMDGHEVVQAPDFLEDAYCENGGTTFLLNLFLRPDRVEATLRYVDPPVSEQMAKRVGPDLESVVEFLAGDPARPLADAPTFAALAEEFRPPAP